MVKFNLTTVLIAIIMVLTALVGTMWQANSENKRLAGQYSSINKELNDSLTTVTNKYGEAVAQKAAAEANLELLSSTYADDFKWIKQHMGIQDKNVKGIFKALTETTGGGSGTIDTIVVDDGITRLSFGNSSPWFGFKANVTLNPYTYNYEYWAKDSVTLVPYRKGKDLYVRGVSANPHTKITGLQGILVATDPKNKRWGIGPSIQIGYDTQIRITPGLSVQYSIIRF